MAKAKYKQYYEKMLEKEQALFDEFKPIHDLYKADRNKFQNEFNQVGRKVVEAIHDWERKLCSAMGRTQYAKYSETVSEKFWDLIREDFDQIDMVGVKIE